MWDGDDDGRPYEAAISVISRSARSPRISRGANICIKMTERRIFVIENRVPVIFTVVGVENDSRFLINMFRISNTCSRDFVQPTRQYIVD